MTILKTDTVSGKGNTDGTVFEGDITFDSLNYMTLPKGTTNQRVNSAGGRAVIPGGYNPSVPAADRNINSMVYIQIQTQGNALDFGDLSFGSASGGSCGSSTRGLIGGSYIAPGIANSLNNIDYITMASKGNAVEYGDTDGMAGGSGRMTCASTTRALAAGGGSHPAYSTQIGYIAIATGGTAVDFGDTTQARGLSGGLSNAHGGLG